jgi:hypothetical protein
VPGTTAEEKFESIVAAMSRFAGRRLVMDSDVYESEKATNDRNRGIAHLLDGYDRMYCDPDLATDVYTRQCSVRVSARDLAVMGATLANGGVNPVTGEQAIETRYCKRVLAVLATAGLYELCGRLVTIPSMRTCARTPSTAVPSRCRTSTAGRKPSAPSGRPASSPSEAGTPTARQRLPPRCCGTGWASGTTLWPS